jgi:hypothetical protein
MTELTLLASEITLRYGTIKRARGCFLYTAKGVRLTDLFQEGGRAILGWGGGSAFTLFKNVLSRGITGSFDTDFTPCADCSKKSQLDRAVSELLAGERTVKVFTSKQAALQNAVSFAGESTSFWRPWNPENVDWCSVKAVIIEPPLPWTESLWLLALSVPAESAPLNNSAPSKIESEVQDAIDSDAAAAIPCARIPAPLAAAVTRSVYDMIAALQVREEKDWFIYDTVITKYWTRKGPYLYPKIKREQYGDFLLYCLDCGIVVSPVYEQPSIVPFGADKGVFRALEKSPFPAE